MTDAAFSLVSVSPRHRAGKDDSLKICPALWDGILCNFFGYLLISFFMVLNGRAGSVYHVSIFTYTLWTTH